MTRTKEVFCISADFISVSGNQIVNAHVVNAHGHNFHRDVFPQSFEPFGNRNA